MRSFYKIWYIRNGNNKKVALEYKRFILPLLSYFLSRSFMVDLDAKKMQLTALFDRDKFYKVPEYQRPYSWEEDQFNDLIGDLLDADKTQEYFLGTVVLHSKEGVYEIVDGQQRLTTLMILLACLRDLIENKDYKKAIQEKIVQDENVVDKIPKKTRLEVKDREIFKELISDQGGTKKQKSEQLPEPQWRYLEAIRIFNSKLGQRSQKDLEEFSTFISTKCLVIFLATTTFDDAFKLFTIVNDRGKQLRGIDILKARNIAPDVIQEETIRNSISQRWEDQEKMLGEETFENLLYLIRFIYLKEKPHNDLLSEYENLIFKKGLIKKGEDFVDIVVEYSALYNDVFNEQTYFKGIDDDKKRNKLSGLIFIMNNEFKASEWKACILFYAKKFKLDGIAEFISLMELKYLEGWIEGINKDNRTIVFGKILKAIDESSKYMDVLQAIKIDIENIKLKTKENVYGKGYCKYLLLKLELVTSEHEVEKYFEAKSIEHVLPQHPRNPSQWQSDFTPQEREEWADKIANLVLLSKSKNSSANNYDFDDKKKKYLEGKVSDYPRSIQVLTYEAWNVSTLSSRQDDAIHGIISNVFELKV